ncbi:MAG: glycosyltransferase family 39 protein, partial [bacterium]
PAEWSARAAPLFGFFLFQVSCLAAGRAIMALARMRADSVWEAPLFLPLGWAAAGTAAWGLSLCGLAFLPVLAAAALAPLGLRAGARLRLPALPRRIPGLEAVVWLLALLLTAIAGLAPESQVDPLHYHYGSPLRTLRLHRYAPWPDNLSDNFPCLWESLLLPLLAWGGETATRLFNPLILAILSVGVFRLARESLPRRWAVTAAAWLAASPFLAFHALSAKNDLLVAAMGFGGLLWLLPGGRQRGSGRRAALAGALSGAAFATKLTGGYLLPAAAVTLAMQGRAGRRRARPFAAGCLVLVLPTCVSAWLRTGDPVFPAGYPLFRSAQVSDVSVLRGRENLYSVTRQDSADISKWRNFEGLWPPDGGHYTFMRWAVWLPVALLSPGPWPPAARAAWAALAVLAGCWFLGPPAVRYGSPLFPLGVFLAVTGLAHATVRRRGRLWPGLARSALLLQFVHLATSYGAALPAGLGLERSGDFLARTLGSYQQFASVVNRLAPPPARLVSVGEIRQARFLARMDLAMVSAVTCPLFPLVHDSRTPGEIWKRIRQRGWTHVLYNRYTAMFWRRSFADDRWTEHDLARWAACWERHAEPLAESHRADPEQGYFYLIRLAPRTTRPVHAVLPGIESWAFRLDEAFRYGDEREPRRVMDAIRRAAGGFAITDAIEAVAFHGRIDPARHEALLRRAVARGWRGVTAFADLAGHAAADGRREEAARWIAAVRAIEPGLSDAALLAMMRRARATHGR